MNPAGGNELPAALTEAAENRGDAASVVAAAAAATGDNFSGLPSSDPVKKAMKTGGLFVFFKGARDALKLDELGLEIAHIAVPAALALAADPLASLVDTAFVGRLGPVEIAAVGVSIAVFNQVSKVAIYPLVSVTTSFVAEEDDASRRKAAATTTSGEEPGTDIETLMVCSECHEMEVILPADKSPDGRGSCVPIPSLKKACSGGTEKRFIPSVSSAIVVGGVLGILQSVLLIFGGRLMLNIMGVKSNSPMMAPAHRYLTLRSLGAPAVLLSLAVQGVFRGFKDTKTPLYATVAGDITNIILDPIFIFTFEWGVSGAAIAHVLSQYLISFILLGRLTTIVTIVPSSIKDFKFRRFLKCGSLLLARVIAVTFCVTLAASMAARRGPIPMAAFQICLQLWLSTSLLADGLAVAGQAILASAFANGDQHKAVAAAARVLQLSIVLGVSLSIFIWLFMQFGAGVFSRDTNVLRLVHLLIPFVAGTQTLNSLAFVFDGVNFGASDYAYSAYSMVVVAVITIICLFLLSASHGFVGIWIALVIFISLRALAGIWRMGAARGPWSFLKH